TLLGDRRYDDRLPDQTPAGHEREVWRLQALLDRVNALDAHRLGAGARVTWGALRGEIESDLALRRCHLQEWAVDPRDGPQVLFLNLAMLQTVTTPAQGRALVGRWQKLGSDLDDRIANLERGLAAGKVATRGSVERVLRQLDDLLASATADWVLMAPASASHPDASEADRAAVRTGVSEAVEHVIRPAFIRFRDVL